MDEPLNIASAAPLPPDSPFAQLLGSAGTDGDPRTAMILNCLQQAMRGTNTENELTTLRARLESLTRAAGILRDRMVALAAALGACPRCMGENPSCPACGGDGIPGARRPDPEAFDRYVMPAVRRARAVRRATSMQAGLTEEPS